jgi:hypothetical protein
MASKKSDQLAVPGTVTPSGKPEPTSVLVDIVERARKSKKADIEMLDILTKHILRPDARENAAERAAADLLKLGEARAALPDKKP